MLRLSALILASSLVATACDDATSSSAPTPDDSSGGPTEVAFDDFKADAPPSPTSVVATVLGNSTGQGAVLELVVTDVWGRLPDRKSTLKLLRESDQQVVNLTGYLRPVLIRLSKAGRYRLEADVPDHLKESMRFEVKESGGVFTIAQPADQVTHWSFSVDPRAVDGTNESIHSLYLGLEHTIFASSGPPPRRGNQIELFDNGRDTFSTMAEDLAATRQSFHLSLWLMRADFELRRNPDWRAVTAAQHKGETIVEHLKRAKGTKRILLAEFGGREDYVNEVNLDAALETFGNTRGDGIELMMQANETEVPYYSDVQVNAGGWSYRARLLDKYPEWSQRKFKNQEHFKVGKYDRTVKFADLQAASYHQKFAILDDHTAWLGGMNMNYADWDRTTLAVFDTLRIEPGTSASKLAKIEAGEAQSGVSPRKDYMVRVEGPLVHDIQHLFQRRWDLGRQEKALYHGNTSPFTITPARDDPDANNEGVQAQLNVTMPMPFWEHSLLEGYQRAIASADDYIFIEDQYFRAPLLNQMMLDRMAVDPDLRLIVVTKDVGYKDPGRKWTALSQKAFQDAYPNRFVMLTLRASDVRQHDDDMVATFADVDIHSKMFIVDDEVMSVGSCNKNNRGVIYEGEANVLIRDTFFVNEARRNVWARMVGPEYAEQMQDPEVAFEVFRNLADHNDAIYRAWNDRDGELSAAAFTEDLRPVGLVYGLEIPQEWWFDPGPDFY